MKSNRLTARQVEAAKPGNKRLEIADGGNSLYLIVQPSGRRSWAVRYRHNDKPKKLTLGKYPAMTLVKVAELLEDGAKVEIEATAVIP